MAFIPRSGIWPAGKGAPPPLTPKGKEAIMGRRGSEKRRREYSVQVRLNATEWRDLDRLPGTGTRPDRFRALLHAAATGEPATRAVPTQTFALERETLERLSACNSTLGHLAGGLIKTAQRVRENGLDPILHAEIERALKDVYALQQEVRIVIGKVPRP
jgi:hypothetical protein